MELQSVKNRFGIIGNAPALNYALNIAIQVANTDLSVLIVGESGVGKEIFSQIIHTLSSRKHNPFIAVNCGAIPEGTIDSELFGHEKGSFTGAVEARKGYFETVNGGTIFLDEIGEMPVGTQARLLRLLESGEYIRVGSSKVQKTNVRVVAATNKDLLELTKQGKFREDLYYRLSTVPIRVPSLRDRKEDILLLFRKFASDFADKYKRQTVQLHPDAQQYICNYPWYGNVRELKNIAEQISVLSTEKEINLASLQPFFPAAHNGNSRMLVPMNSNVNNGNEISTTERDILYKLFFDLKKDMNDLKAILFELVQKGTLPASTLEKLEGLTNNNTHHALPSIQNTIITELNPNFNQTPTSPIFISTNNVEPTNLINPHEIVEESLHLMEREKEFIVKALKKYRSRRKDAARELGISERTLYRKIKEYEIED